MRVFPRPGKEELVVIDDEPTVIVDPEVYAEARRLVLATELTGPEPAPSASRLAPTG